LACFHKREVERIALGVGHRHTLAGAQVVERLARQLAVARKLAHREVDVAVLGRIGEPVGLEQFDDPEHLRDVIGGTRLQVGRLHPQRGEVLVHRADEALGVRAASRHFPPRAG
jgi:hypothetical protein